MGGRTSRKTRSLKFLTRPKKREIPLGDYVPETLRNGGLLDQTAIPRIAKSRELIKSTRLPVFAPNKLPPHAVATHRFVQVGRWVLAPPVVPFSWRNLCRSKNRGGGPIYICTRPTFIAAIFRLNNQACACTYSFSYYWSSVTGASIEGTCDCNPSDGNLRL